MFKQSTLLAIGTYYRTQFNGCALQAALKLKLLGITGMLIKPLLSGRQLAIVSLEHLRAEKYGVASKISVGVANL